MTRIEDANRNVVILVAVLDLVRTILVAAVKVIRITIIAVLGLIFTLIIFRIFLTGNAFVGDTGDGVDQASRQRR